MLCNYIYIYTNKTIKKMENIKEIMMINKINKHQSKLEKECKNLIFLIERHMTFKEDCSFNNMNTVAFRISSIKSELEKLEQQHLNK